MFMPAVMATIFIHGLLSVSRILALFQGEAEPRPLAPLTFRSCVCAGPPAGYHAPLGVYPQLRDIQHKLGPDAPTPLNVCVGKEWYRFPSSFLLPSHRWRLRFVPSEFRAQLPHPFVAPPPQGTKVVPNHFNDRNEEEPSQYVSWHTQLLPPLNIIPMMVACPQLHFSLTFLSVTSWWTWTSPGQPPGSLAILWTPSIGRWWCENRS